MFTEPKQMLNEEERKHARHDPVDYTSARYALFNALHPVDIINFLGGLRYLGSLVVDNPTKLETCNRMAKMILPRIRLTCELLFKLRDEHGIVPQEPVEGFDKLMSDDDTRFIFKYLPYGKELYADEKLREIVRLASCAHAISFNDFFSTLIGTKDKQYVNPEYRAYIALPAMVALAEKLDKLMDDAGVSKSTEFDITSSEANCKHDTDWTMDKYYPELSYVAGRKQFEA